MPSLEPAEAAGRRLIQLVSDRRAFQPDGFRKDRPRCTREPLPDPPRQPTAGRPWVDAGAMQDFGRVDIADAGHRALVQEGDLDRSPGIRQAALEVVARDAETVGAERCRPAGPVEAVGINQTHRAEPALIPKHEWMLRTLSGRLQVHHEPQMIDCRRRRHEHESCHPRLDHQPPSTGEKVDFEGQPLSKPFDRRELAAADRGRDPSRRGRRTDRSLRAPRELGIGNPASHEVQDSATHRFDFGELGHWGESLAGPEKCL